MCCIIYHVAYLGLSFEVRENPYQCYVCEMCLLQIGLHAELDNDLISVLF